MVIYHVQIAKDHGGIMRFINVSCLGASPSSPSRMLRAKAAAEEAILHELPEVNKPFTRPTLCLFIETKTTSSSIWNASKRYSMILLLNIDGFFSSSCGVLGRASTQNIFGVYNGLSC